jgi:hypothetical protein
MTDAQNAFNAADSLREFASLMVDEVIAKVRIQLDEGQPLSLADQKHLLNQLIKDRALVVTPAPSDQADAEARLHMIVSHATGGALQYDSAMSVNSICVEISAMRNKVWAHAQEALIDTLSKKPSDQAGWRGIETCPVNEYVLFRFEGPFHDSECPGVSVGKLAASGVFWLTAIWAGSTPHDTPVAWQPLPTAPTLTAGEGGGDE